MTADPNDPVELPQELLQALADVPRPSDEVRERHIAAALAEFDGGVTADDVPSTDRLADVVPLRSRRRMLAVAGVAAAILLGLGAVRLAATSSNDATSTAARESAESAVNDSAAKSRAGGAGDKSYDANQPSSDQALTTLAPPVPAAVPESLTAGGQVAAPVDLGSFADDKALHESTQRMASQSASGLSATPSFDSVQGAQTCPDLPASWQLVGRATVAGAPRLVYQDPERKPSAGIVIVDPTTCAPA